MKSTFGTTALFSFLFLFLAINSPHNLISTAQLLPDSEVQALLIISLRLGIKQWNGVTSSSCSSGTGLNEISKEDTLGNVTCNCGFENNTVCHVTNIQLKNLNLIGELPNEFSELTYLTEINLIRNNLNGTIPRSWASLPLVILSLVGNYISGTISSDIGKIATLEELVLEDNFMEGTLPPELGNLRRLRRAIFSGNNFNGTLPPTFANLTSLEDFRISGTSISGRIPMFIGNWKNLTQLHMQGTSMEGPIPSTISLLGKLTDLIISDLNVVNMPFPDLRDLTNLKELVLRNCSIIGELPSYMGASFPNMTNLDLSFNRLSGTIAQSQVQLMLEGKLKFVYLTNNSLTGNTSWLSSTTQENRFIDISYNNFSGLVESNCRTQSVNTMSSISTVAGNSIAWCLKKDLPCSKKADFYKLFINCGGISMQFGNEQYEQDVEPMGASSFYSKEDESWASSTMGDFLGEEGSNYSASSDAVGSFREDIYSSARLAPQSLKYYGLCLRKGRYSVALHFAEIMFTSYASTTKGTRIFDVYIQGYRVLEDFNIAEEAGGIGRRLIKIFNDVIVTGSSLEIHLYWRGKGTTAVPVRGVYGPLISAIEITSNYEITGLSAGVVAGIVVGSFVAILLLLVVLWKLGYLGKDPVDEVAGALLIFSRKLGYRGEKFIKDNELKGQELQTGYFTLRQIKAATSNFDPANKIGEGGFGPVFKGVLSDGSVIAVKQLSSKSKQGNKEFITEIGMLSAVQNEQLVRLYGCCIENNQLLLIYEYMENNSLANALFGRLEERLNLDWPTRQKICLGIAKGLRYLHEESRIKIVHRDMKATNVLLDKDLNAKISDFGLAKLDDEEKTHISTRIAGTIGYMAPEYAMSGYLTDKADVYSFGIVALEIVSGRSITSYIPNEEFVYLLEQARVLQEHGNLLDLVDPVLGTEYSKKEALQMLNISLLCTNPSATIRPAMSFVVRMLEGEMTISEVPVAYPTSVGTENLSDDSAIQSSLYSHGSHTRSKSMAATWKSSFYSHNSQKRSLSMAGSWKSSLYSHDSQTERLPTDGTWIDSSVSSPHDERNQTPTSKLLPDHV